MTHDALREALQAVIKGDVSEAPEEIAKMSRDASLFTRTPDLIVYPKDADDVSALVREAARLKKEGVEISLTARAAGTCMSGGPLTRSVVVNFMKYMNHLDEVTEDHARTEPGVFYRDFEKATLAHGVILPSYPASRELAALGGMVANNSAGERTLEYGQTSRYLEELDVVLSDGSRTTFKSLTPEQVEEKKKLTTLEGAIYRGVDQLLTANAKLIESHRLKVSKNVAGYALADVRDSRTGATNLAKLIAGSQGTLALWTNAKLKLVRPKGHRAMMVVFLYDMKLLPEIITRVLPLKPESFESYDRHTFELAVRFLPGMLGQMGLVKAAELGIDFIPEVAMVAAGGVPEMILMAEFAADTEAEADAQAEHAKATLTDLKLTVKIEKNERESEKYWIVRRESFALLRKNMKNLYPVPFIDDFVIPPLKYPEFMPRLNALLDQYKDHMTYTVAGHIGNGNFHLIPLMDLTKQENRDIILELAPKVYKLVISYGGTTTGEHNDGIIRTPYLPMLYGEEMVALFKKVKELFDPQNIMNPGKKVGGTFEDVKRDMLTVNVH